MDYYNIYKFITKCLGNCETKDRNVSYIYKF